MGTPAAVRVALVIEDDVVLGRAMAREIQWRARGITTEVFACARPARPRIEQLGGGRLAAVVVDVHLPDGSGLELAQQTRVMHPRLPILVVTGDDSLAINHKAFALQCQLLLKPFVPAMLTRFVSALDCAECYGHDAAAHLETFACSAALSEREREVLVLAMTGMRRREMADQLGIAESTLKTIVNRMLRKTGGSTLAELAARAWSMPARR
jgi:DNA-binding NarL/FixJ family response regulator